jgi:hypothetical protein
MSVILPDFLKVLPADFQYGYDGACVLALVRYVTALKGENNGRKVIEDAMWWHASHADIAASLDGQFSHDSIRRTVSKLESAGALLSRYMYADDRTKAYCVPEHPLRENASPLSTHYANSRNPNANSRNPNAKSRNPLREIAFSSSSTEELKEELEEVGEGGTAPPVISGEVVSIDKIARSGGSAGCGHLSGVCAISSNGANGQVPARIVPGDLVVADMDGHDAPYLRLGFVPSASEPTLYGVTPPSRYCAKHQPSGIDGNCWGCGNARIYHDKTWPGTEHGMKYRTYQAAGDEMVKQEGRALGRDLRRQAMVEKLSRSADAAMFGFNPDSAVDQKMADWLSVKDRPEEVIEGEIA